METIKFRVWDGHTKSYMHKDKETHYLPTVEVNEKTGELTLVTKDDLYDIQLYIGLLDRNGVEIYEGDICKWGKRSWDETKAIEWRDGRYWWGNSLVICCEMECSEMEVIGNIYENPELLKNI